MSGRSRCWVCCLAVVVFTALGGWRVAETAGPGPTDPVGSVGALSDATAHDAPAASLQSRRVVAEPAAAKRAEIERLVAVTVAAVLVLVALAGGLVAGAGILRTLLDRSGLRSRAPPLSFVS